MVKMKRCCAKKGYICDLSEEQIVPGDGYYKLVLTNAKDDEGKTVRRVIRIKASVYCNLSPLKQRYLYLYIQDNKSVLKFLTSRRNEAQFKRYVKQKMQEKLKMYNMFLTSYTKEINELEKNIKELD